MLRAIGITKFDITRLYFYEALILVFAASFLGILVGTLVGLTMVLQMDLFLSLDFKFFFPWTQTIEIFVLSIFCAFFSTFGPTTKLTKRSISAVFHLS